MQGQFPTVEDMTVVERALQEMRTLVRAIQEEVAQAQDKKNKQEEEECGKKQAEMKIQQEEQKKSAELSVKERAKKQGKNIATSDDKGPSHKRTC